MEKHWTIYCHTHVDSGRRYVGLTSRSMERRWSQHIIQAKSSKNGRWHFPNAIRKYGPQAFSHEVLEICNTLEDANAAEEKWVDHFNTRNPQFGFNLAKGGQHVPHPKKNPWSRSEYREKMSVSSRRRWQDPEFRARHSIIMAEIMHSPEFIAKCSDSQKGKVFSSEHRAKISENMKRLNALKTLEERKAAAAKASNGRKIKDSLRTDDEIQEAYNRKSRISKVLNSIAAVHTPQAIAKHREKCREKAKLNVSDIASIRLLMTAGHTKIEIARMFNVNRKTLYTTLVRGC